LKLPSLKADQYTRVATSGLRRGAEAFGAGEDRKLNARAKRSMEALPEPDRFPTISCTQ